MLKSNAQKILVTRNPSIKNPAIITITAFITNKNSPSEIIVKGMVRITNIGFAIKFSIPSITATIIAVV